MEAIHRYILRVICTVMLCGVVNILYQDSLMKFVTALVVTTVVITPLLQKETINIDNFFAQYAIDSGIAVAEGERVAKQTSNQYIKSKSEEYILNRAEMMGASIQVNVELSETELPVPAAVTVCGSISPYVRQQLSMCIENDLGIDRDEQIWIS